MKTAEKNLKNKILFGIKGFTLVEILISTSIIVLLTGFFLTNYHNTNINTRLNLNAQEMASNISLMQNYSLGSVKHQDSIPAGGWGVFINKNSRQYILFADLNNNREYDLNENFKTVDLGQDISIDSLDTGSLVDSVNITFIAPNPDVYIWDGYANNDYVYIFLKDAVNNKTKRITINFFGLIDVQKN